MKTDNKMTQTNILHTCKETQNLHEIQNNNKKKEKKEKVWETLVRKTNGQQTVVTDSKVTQN